MNVRTQTITAAPVPIQWCPDLPIYASEPFLRAVGDQSGWLGGFDESGEQCCVLPYTMIRKAILRMVRFRVETLPQGNGLSVEEERGFLNSAMAYFRSIGAGVVIPATTNTIFRTFPDGAEAAPYGTYIMDLSQSEESLWGKVSTSHRRKVRFAQKSGVTIREAPELVDKVHRLVHETFCRSSLPFMTLQAFRQYVNGLGNYAKVLVAEHGGALQGGMVVPFSAHTAYYVYGGSIPEAQQGAMHLLHWEAMRLFRGLGVKRYDFVGVRIDPEKGSKQEGLLTFKERFGGQLVQGYIWKCALRPLPYRLYGLAAQLRTGGDIVDHERRRLTLHGAHALAPMCLNHLRMVSSEPLGTPSRVASVWRAMLRKVHQEGVWCMVRSGARKLVSLISPPVQTVHPFDVEFGTDTSGTIEPGALDIPSDRAVHAVRYQTAIVEVFTNLLRDLPIAHDQFVFIDLGSGKGRALLLASELPFKAIIGVELSFRLHNIACKNIQIYKADSQRCRNITALCEDAAIYEIPEDNVVFYLFNPFDAEVMQKVLSNIGTSFLRSPRKMYVLYLKPLWRHVLDGASFLRVMKETDRYVIYESQSTEVP